MDWCSGSLSSLQCDFLEIWFRKTDGFFLTGGAVLVGFLKSPRITRDLDLFTTKADAFEDALHLFSAICREIGADVELLRTAPHFRRYFVRRQGEETLIDLVLDTAPQVFPEKSRINREMVIDTPEEILINKICSIVGRSEPRDFFDVYFLSLRGHDVEKALTLASVKDGGVNEESLLFVLSEIAWDSFSIPGFDDETIDKVRSFFGTWAESLALKLFPGR